MIYALHELQRWAVAPLAAWATFARTAFASPYSPLAYLPASAGLAAGSELLGRLVRRYDKPDFGIDAVTTDARRVRVVEDCVDRHPFCRLIQFVRLTPHADPRLLLVAPLSGHHASLLRDTVRALLPRHDVHITDWVDARQVPIAVADRFGFDDYVGLVQRFIRRLSPGLHVVAVGQACAPTLAAVALLAAAGDAAPVSLTLVGGPIDTRCNPTEVDHYAEARGVGWFEARVIARVPGRYPGYLRRVYPGFLQHAGFVAMHPDRHLQAHLEFFHSLVRGDGDSVRAHRLFYDEYNAVMDLPAEFYLETLERVFMSHRLPRGELVVGGRTVDPAAIRDTALMTIEGELDDLCGVGQTAAAHPLCRRIPEGRRARLTVPGLGHYGLFSGRRWREQVCPQLTEFIRRSGLGQVQRAMAGGCA